jgi:hypothetical protein
MILVFKTMRRTNIWSVIKQMVPGSFMAQELSAEPGITGRILRVTIGVLTLFFVSYYTTMQLRSLLTSP